MNIDTMELSPWAAVNRMFSTMRGLIVVIDGKAYAGEAVLEQDEEGFVTIHFPKGKKKK